MRIPLFAALGGLLLSCCVGCQCCPTANCHYRTVDCIADIEPELDCLYHPELDISRIGKADWCSCWWNRMWCGCACREQCVYVPAYGPPICSPCPPVPPRVAPCRECP